LTVRSMPDLTTKYPERRNTRLIGRYGERGSIGYVRREPG